MEKVVYDSGVIRVVVRPIRDNSNEVDQSLPSWQKVWYTEAWRAAEGVASIRDAAADGLQQQHELNFWFARVNTCMAQGLALASFVNGGSVSGVCLVLPDNMDPSRAVLVHLSKDAFGGEATERAFIDWAKQWAAERGRRLMQKVVTVEWKEA